MKRKPVADLIDKPLPKDAYAAVHLTDGRYWINSSAVYPTREQVQMDHDENMKAIPHWCKENPMVRIARVLITVID